MLMFQMFHVTLQSESPLIARQTPTQRVLELRVRPPESQKTSQRTPLNLALVLDRSGSMSGFKLEYVKQAAQHVLELLSRLDRVALVTFDDEVTINVPTTSIGSLPKAEIANRIAAIRSGGSTFLSGGWMQGCQEVAMNGNTGGQVNRVLLLTDGEANVGIQDPETLGNHARELAQRGVSTSTFGVGEGFNEHLLEGMANHGSGNFYYIANPSDIPSIFAREFKELSAVTARNVQVTITIPEHASVEVLGGWRHVRDGNHLQLFLGDLAAGRDQEIYLKLLLAPSDTLESLEVKVYATGSGVNETDLSDETALHFRYADAEEVAKVAPLADVMERFSRVHMSDQTTSALKLERNGEREKARQVILSSLAENLPNLPPDQAQYYEEMAQRMERGMAENDRKTSQYAAYQTKRRREDVQ